MIEAEIEEEEPEDDDDDAETQIDKLLLFTFRDIPEKKEEVDREISRGKEQRERKKSEDEGELRFFRLENLIQRRPFLLSNVVLRQNPNNVYEWLNRVKLCEGLITSDDNDEHAFLAIKTFTEAIAAVDPQQAFGKPSKLWIAFAQFYERHDSDLENANLLLHKAT